MRGQSWLTSIDEGCKLYICLKKCVPLLMEHVCHSSRSIPTKQGKQSTGNQHCSEGQGTRGTNTTVRDRGLGGPTLK